jgi:ADP-dependent NAD(P)H-hydrate dehydratase
MSARPIHLAALADHPLPPLHGVTEKDGRGQVLVVAGSAGVPGAGVLTGTAALRAGAGKLQLGAIHEIALPLGLAMPEAAIIGTPRSADGEMIDTDHALARAAAAADAIVIGPGMLNRTVATDLACALITAAPDAAFVIDAAAMTALGDHAATTRSVGGRFVLTPHAGEMAKLSGLDKAAVVADPLAAARTVAAALSAVVVMKGNTTFVVSPDGQAYVHEEGCVGLATSGSGDVLAGLIGGFLARGAAPVVAALWGVCVHGDAGARLTARIGQVGFLARELLTEAPLVLAELDR